MKHISKTAAAFFLLIIVLSSCGKDNFDAPESTLRGKVVYNGNGVNVRGTGEAVRLQLYQDGYAKRDPIDVFVGQDGTFSAKLFDGEYKMVTRDGNGPWVNKRDTTIINLKGSTEVNMEVTPYFTITDEQLSISGTTFNASFTINQIVPSAKINKVMLILSKTQFADDVNNVFRTDIKDANVGSVVKSVNFGDNKDASNVKALFGRVGVLTEGADQAIYSQVIRLK